MKKARIVVFALLTLGAAAPLAPDAGAPPPVAEVSGAGILGALGCAACLGSGMTMMTFGWGGVWAAALAGPCVGVCASAF
ncbi:MAG: hypothetical protein AMXMBFR53_37200 [Gemmatimonadota bacterium]